MNTGVGQELESEVLTTVDRLQQIAAPWQRLWQRCQGASPFQSPEWLLPWCRCWAGEEVRALALWRDDSLVALAPWRIDVDGAGRRRGMLIGAGTSDYLDVLVDPSCPGAGAAAVLAQLAELRLEWDVCELSQLMPGGALVNILRESGAPGQISSAVPCPVLPLETSDGSIAGCVPAAQYKKLQYCRCRLARSGVVQYEHVSEENYDALFAILIRLHTRRWQDRGELGGLADSSAQHFHRDAARHMLRSDLLRLYALRLDDRVIAIYYGFHANRRSYYYLSGFDHQCTPGVRGTSRLTAGSSAAWAATRSAAPTGNAGSSGHVTSRLPARRPTGPRSPRPRFHGRFS